MAVKEFNCNKLKRTFWPFTLKDKVDENGNVVEKGKENCGPYAAEESF